MAGFFLIEWFFLMRRRRARQMLLAAAQRWPTVSAKLLKPSLMPKEELAEGSLAQFMQIEVPYYFSLDEGFYGGHLRSVPCSDSEGRRTMEKMTEGMPVTVRYNPANPDEAVALAEDNEGALPFTIWPM